MGKRMTIALSPKLNEDIQEMVDNPKSNITSKVEALRNGFTFYKYMLEELNKGNKICIADQRNRIIREIVIVS